MCAISMKLCLRKTYSIIFTAWIAVLRCLITQAKKQGAGCVTGGHMQAGLPAVETVISDNSTPKSPHKHTHAIVHKTKHSTATLMPDFKTIGLCVLILELILGTESIKKECE